MSLANPISHSLQTDPSSAILQRRQPDFGMIPQARTHFNKETTLKMFEKICLIRYFELNARQAQIDKKVECPLYLSLGQESIAAAAAAILQSPYVLGQHRGHAAYLAFGGDPIKLADELLGLPTGCNKGMGGSPPIHDIDKKIIGHVGLIGDQVPVAAGIALSKPEETVLTLFGDGAAEEDYVLSALGFAASRKLKILFICDDNDLSVLTPTVDRRTWMMDEVAQGFGIPAVDISDDPWTIAYHIEKFQTKLPALINIRTCREYWHVGTGQDAPPEWNRFELVKNEMDRLGYKKQKQEIELHMKEFTEALWQQRLHKQSKTLPAST